MVVGQLNQRLQRQLHELHIDTGESRLWPSVTWGLLGVLGRIRRHWVFISVGLALGIGVLIPILAALLLAQNVPASDATVGQVSLDDLTFDVTVPAVPVTARGESVLTLGIQAENDSSQEVVVTAGSLLIVDSRGLLLGPTWYGPDGTVHDGLAESHHTLFALDPGGQTQLNLYFIVRGVGPLRLRYTHNGDRVELELPTALRSAARATVRPAG